MTFIFRGIHTAGRPFRAPFNCCVDRTLAAAVGFKTGQLIKSGWFRLRSLPLLLISARTNFLPRLYVVPLLANRLIRDCAQWTTAAQDRRWGMAQDGGTRGGTFHGEMDRCRYS